LWLILAGDDARQKHERDEIPNHGRQKCSTNLHASVRSQ